MKIHYFAVANLAVIDGDWRVKNHAWFVRGWCVVRPNIAVETPNIAVETPNIAEVLKPPKLAESEFQENMINGMVQSPWVKHKMDEFIVQTISTILTWHLEKCSKVHMDVKNQALAGDATNGSSWANKQEYITISGRHEHWWGLNAHFILYIDSLYFHGHLQTEQVDFSDHGLGWSSPATGCGRDRKARANHAKESAHPSQPRPLVPAGNNVLRVVIFEVVPHLSNQYLIRGISFNGTC